MVVDLAVAVPVLPAEHRCGANDRHAGGVDRDEDHRLLLVGGCVRVGAAHHDEDLAPRVRRSRRPPLTAVDDVVGTVPGDGGFDVAGVAAGHRRLGHREGAADLAVEQRPQPLRPLLLGAEHVQDLHVAGVRCGAVECLGRDFHAPSGHFGQRRVLQVGQSRLGRQE
ncbi:Uncharacterised protein [Mycobacterium tuberculosis]|uniref:Uncharacterized protein n=1 Tax=Mycobacterium tuberculosis TaxID=1773 RepID=A0A916PH41_MYCTX|nr:Uncharacterised protein [Mycobacterium tuberculosis]